MTAAQNALVVFRGLEVGILDGKIRDLDLHGLSQHRACALPQDLGELIVRASWLNQFGHVIVGHARRRELVVGAPHTSSTVR